MSSPLVIDTIFHWISVIISVIAAITYIYGIIFKKDRAERIKQAGIVVFPSTFLLIALGVLMLFSACGRENDRIIMDAVIKYDTLLAEGYRNLNMTPLIEAATEKHAAKVYIHMAALGEGRIKMDSMLKDIKFIEIKKLSGSKAEVKTREMWDYAYINFDSGKSVFDNSVRYELKYSLEKKSGRWLVADITIEKVEEKKSSEDLLDGLFKQKKSRQSKGGK